MIIPTFESEKKYLADGYDFVIGIDEAGRGPLAGPVVAAACVLKNKEIFEIFSSSDLAATFSQGEKEIVKNFDLIRDSKTLSEKQREKIFDFILENFYVGIGICDHKTIDRTNILEAAFLAMKKALSDLNKNNPHPAFASAQSTLSRQRERVLGSEGVKRIILVDGNKVIPNISVEQEAIVGGDKKVKSIAAASIMAKVTRDRMMHDYHKQYPQYDFAKHKGYGTKAHMEALKKYGPCEIHRKSFKPVSTQ